MNGRGRVVHAPILHRYMAIPRNTLQRQINIDCCPHKSTNSQGSYSTTLVSLGQLFCLDLLHLLQKLENVENTEKCPSNISIFSYMKIGKPFLFHIACLLISHGMLDLSSFGRRRKEHRWAIRCGWIIVQFWSKKQSSSIYPTFR